EPSPTDDAADAADFARFIAGQDPADAAAARWLVRQLAGLTPEETAERDAWLAADPAHARAWQALNDVWGRMDDLPPDGVNALRTHLPSALPAASSATAPAPLAPPGNAAIPATPAAPAAAPAWPDMAAAPPAPPALSPLPPKPQAAPMPPPGRPAKPGWLATLVRPLALAAVASLVVGAGWQIWLRQPLFSHHYATARGQQQEIRLPDGSALHLDTATRANVTYYRQRREVQLTEGQARFSVQARPGQPFHVQAGPLRVSVLGTRFAVRHTQTGLGQGGASVAVEEGRVRVTHITRATPPAAGATTPGDSESLHSLSSIELGAGQAIAIGADGQLGPVQRLPAASAAAWREGRVSFSGEPLAQALAEFERYGPTRLIIRDPAVAALRVHGSFSLHRVDAFARALPHVLPVRLQAAPGGQIEIVRR
ncbi:MAG: FecR domain-containing protein, partial [Comamonadaceae bacterium]|nr:FecR domain-containing protein [Comamonadaceae bacterium]